MDAIITDLNGNKKNFLWQYDKGQTLVLENLDYDISPEVHFTTSAYSEALISKGVFQYGTLRVAIPDVLLLDARKITVYLYLNKSERGETVKEIDIFVRPRKKPNNYIMADNMYAVGIGSLKNAINNYLDLHAEFVEDIVVDYTTVQLIDDSTGVEYVVGINNNKLYICPVGEVGNVAYKNVDQQEF